MPPTPPRTRVVAFGTYDKVQHPRVGILIQGLRDHGVDVVEINERVWASTDDKIRATRSSLAVMRGLVRTLAAWTRLARAYRDVGPHDAVVVGYMGQLDVLLARLLVKKPTVVVLDLFVSLWDTAVADRKLVQARSLKSRVLARLDRWAYRAADVVLFDTDAQRDHFLSTFGLEASKARVV